MDVMEALRTRRSIRAYTDEKVPDSVIEQIIDAGLLVPTAKNRIPFEFIVVRDKETLKRMAPYRESGTGQMLLTADTAIVVLGDEELADTYVEDCSNALMSMHLLASSLGVGSCWIQCRMRTAPGGGPAEEFLRDIFGFPKKMRAVAVLSLGMPAQHPEPRPISDQTRSKVHREKY